MNREIEEKYAEVQERVKTWQDSQLSSPVLDGWLMSSTFTMVVLIFQHQVETRSNSLLSLIVLGALSFVFTVIALRVYKWKRSQRDLVRAIVELDALHEKHDEQPV